MKKIIQSIPLFCLGWVLAQSSQTGTLRGKVLDPSGVPLPGVTILVAQQDGSYPKTVFTGENGFFQVGFIKPGNYKVTAQLNGFGTHVLDNIFIKASEVRKVEIQLRSTQVEESMVVTANLPLIDTSTAEVDSRMQAETLERLPTTRNANDLLEFSAGTSGSGIFGGSGDQANAYTLDGVSVNSTGFGGSFLLPNVNWIEEFQVKGLGAGAEYGNFQGGLVNIVTKSGSNTFEGSVHSIFETSSANDSNLRVGEAGSEIDQFMEINADVRGAFIKDRLYYYFSVEQQTSDRNIVDIEGSNQADDIQFFDTQEERTATKLYSKLTWQVSEMDTINFVLGFDDIETENRGLDSFTDVEATTIQDSPALLYNASWEKFLGNHFLEVKFTGYDAQDDRLSKGGQDLPGVIVLGGDRNAGVNAAYTRLRDLSNQSLAIQLESFFELGSTQHQLKSGIDWGTGTWLEQRIRNGGLTWRPEVDDDDIASFTDPSSWAFISSDWGGGIRLDAETVNSAIYLQDNIQVNERMDIQVGLRYGIWEGHIKPGFSSGSQFKAMSDEGLAPRIGATFDLSGDDNLVLKVHWGRYYQSMFALLYDRVIGADAFQDAEYWDWVGAGLPDVNQDYSTPDGNFEFYDSDPTSSEVGIVDNYSQPHVDQSVLSIEKSFGSLAKISLSYTRRENKDILALVDRNLDSNFITYTNVEVWNFRESRPELGPDGNPLYLDTVYVRSPDYNPDYALSSAEDAKRELDQIILNTDFFTRNWDANLSVTYSDLKGNFYSVSGYDNPSGTGVGAFVNLNEQTNFYGNLRNVAEWAIKGRIIYEFPADFLVSAFYRWDSGTPYTAVYSIDTRNNDYYDSNGDLIDYREFTSVDGESIFLESRGSRTYEDYSRIDLRLEKRFGFDRSKLKLALDGFNLLNEDAATSLVTDVNGQDSEDPTSLFGAVRGTQSPRSLQLKVSLVW